jgi:DNA-binding CsgD family transcriptional regulator
MWNIYFILTTIGMLGLLLDTAGVLKQAYLVICGIAAGIGYINAFYMGAGIIKRYFSMSFFKKTLTVVIVLTMAAILLSGITASLFPGKLIAITAVISGLSLIVVTILSPVIYNNLFSHDWMDDFAKKDMIPAGDDFNGYGFTDREKEVCRLLLDGYTLRQIASILKLAYPTVNTYYTSIYRKLNINSKAELLLHFKTGSNRLNS